MTKEAFKECFENHFDSIRNYIYYRCGDPELATDVAQETFLKIWEKDLPYQPDNIKGLLYKIAKEYWISQYRKMETAVQYKFSLSRPTGQNETENSLAYKELKEKYNAVLKTLPLKQREVFLMSRMEALTYKEISERLQISVKAVEKRMRLALHTLKTALHYEG